MFSRFYYELTIKESDKQFTVKLVNEEPSEICTFEWVDATASSSTGFFSNECQNKENCFYSSCSSVTFGNVEETVKAVKIRVLKLGMNPIVGYQNNIYICNYLNFIN